MPTVRVLPAEDVVVQVSDGETVMAAAQRGGYRWPTVCHGEAQCQVCFVTARDGDISRPPPGPVEAEGLATLAERLSFEPGTVRLACQFRPTADCTVYKRGVRPT
jgi:ferredoxin